MKGAISKILLCFFVVAILSFGQVSWAQNNTLRVCRTITPPTLDGIMGEAEWNSQCTFNLELKGVDENLDDNNEPGGDPTPPPPDKPMTLIILKDSENVYFGFHWDHTLVNAQPTHFLLGMGFDFNANGLWEDTDSEIGAESIHTVDDALLVVYLGTNIGEPNPSGWLKIYIPDGLYLLSWGDKDAETDPEHTFQFDAIAGPPDEPTSIYHGVEGPVLDQFGNEVSLCPMDGFGKSNCLADRDYGVGLTSEDGTYSYTLETFVPLALFHSPAGFGFALTHSADGGWTWPALLDTSNIDLSEPESAEALGRLVGDVASGWGRALLDPNADDGPGPVGGVTATVDKVALMMPWIAACAVLGMTILVVTAKKRRT